MDARAMYFPISSLSFHKPITVETGRSVSDVILRMQEGDPDHERGTGCILVVEDFLLLFLNQVCMFLILFQQQSRYQV